MFSQLFGAFLLEQNVITKDMMDSVLAEQTDARAKLGTIAVAAGYLTNEQVEEIHHLQAQQDKRFGDIALEKGYLTGKQLMELLDQQGNAFMKFLQILVEKNCVPVSEIDAYLSRFQETKGFSDQDMKALKKDDIDAIVPVFAFAAKPFVTDVTALVLRNIARFITMDFYIDRIRRVEDYEYHALVGQKINGDYQVWLAFVGKEDDEGLYTLATGYAGEQARRKKDIAYDVIGEFANICSGLFASGLSEKGIFIDMESPFAHESQQMKGKGYIVPIYLKGKLLELFISVNEDIVPGTVPYKKQVAKQAGSAVTENSKGTIIIVDDSMLIRHALRVLVEKAGYTVVCEAENGEEAIEVYQKYHPDMISLDITMPVMDGVEALRRIKELDPAANVVMITAAGQQQKVIEAIKLGASKFIVKPFSRDEVLDTIAEVIR
ncbi:MAG: response regulator [Lachnospiraceae bacterium]|nr:response regulator [Lachnospiraceae bacterium]MBD5483357.1 response regulator [Lachnospiraceae bacterium]